MYNTICNIIHTINTLLWGNATVILIFTASLFMTIRCGSVRLCHPVAILKSTLLKRSPKAKDKNSISPFQALSTALAASMGTGNIIGVAAAISIGGCGAVFWMIVSSFAVMSLAFAENVLGVKYKNISTESNIYGPMLYIENALGSKKAARFYAVSCMLASFGIGSMAQSNSAASSLRGIGISPKIIGAVLALITAFMIFHGGNFIAKAAEKIIPFVSLTYIVVSIVIIALNRENIPFVLRNILESSTGALPFIGGFSGALINNSLTVGMRRGIFSNEAGMGSSVFAHTDTSCSSPAEMGMWAMLEVFIDTVLCCTLTALVILCTGADTLSQDAAETVITAFDIGLNRYAGYFVMAANTIFAAASIFGWYYYGEKCTIYLSRKDHLKNTYRIIYALTVFAGAVFGLDLIWELSDILNAFVMIPNLAAIIILSKEVVPYSRIRPERARK